MLAHCNRESRISSTAKVSYKDPHLPDCDNCHSRSSYNSIFLLFRKVDRSTERAPVRCISFVWRNKTTRSKETEIVNYKSKWILFHSTQGKILKQKCENNKIITNNQIINNQNKLAEMDLSCCCQLDSW